MRSPFLISILGALLMFASSGTGQASSGRLEVDRGELRLRLDNGKVLEREELAGARIIMRSGGQDIQVLVDAVEEDSAVPGGPVILYRLLVEDPVRQTFQNACMPDPFGRRLGLPIQKETGVDFTCTSGAEAKCILMGYRPWDDSADPPMRDLHAACIHMMRADYGADDQPTTQDGTIINVYDRFGIQTPDETVPLPFEAAWGRDGAVCVARPRIAANITLKELKDRYPALGNRLGPEACTEEAMRSHPEALLFNRSAVTVP